MDLFEKALEQTIQSEAPLADRMRPRTLEEFVGQQHILAPGRLLRRAIQADQLSSLIFYGPPGTGKTTLARIIANTTRSHFLSINAVLAGIPAIRECIESAKRFRSEQQRKTILFVDEVHRFNKAQQDALLPHVENGTVVLIGATTENPYFEVIKALVSRSRIFQLRSLDSKDLENILEMAIGDPERGFGNMKIQLDEQAKGHLARVASGDARVALNALELAVQTTDVDEHGFLRINLEIAEESIQQRAVLYDKDGDAHFDTISAFIKSMRGSDPDAALYWMAKMVQAGEDPRFLFRRMIIFASEDVGLADPGALGVVTSAAEAFDYVGMPEGRFHLAQACLYLSTAPKSNSAFAFFDALKTVESEAEDEVPNPLKDGNRDGADFGHGQGYLYPHAFRDHWVAQQYLPGSLQGRVFYQPGDQGYEDGLREDVARKREAQLASFLAASSESYELEGDYWENRTLGDSGELHAAVRERLIRMAEPEKNHLCLVLNGGDGLLLGEMLRKVSDETVYGLVENENQKQVLEKFHQGSRETGRMILAVSDLEGGPSVFGVPDLRFERMIGRNFLQGIAQPWESLEKLEEFLGEHSRIALAETLPSKAQRISGLLEEGTIDVELYQAWEEAETMLYEDPSNPKLGWNDEELKERLEESNWHVRSWQLQNFETPTRISLEHLDSWFSEGGTSPSYGERLQQKIGSEKLIAIHQALRSQVGNRVVPWKSCWLFFCISRSSK
ncbi:MAG: AAA family ATPase [SAR324 cluster bacterium]|nr:AAA family ATPase [SAR324 cluster bacterium]